MKSCNFLIFNLLIFSLPIQTTTDELIERLSVLPPLPKIHYSWPPDFKAVPPPLLEQYVRITRACTVWGEYVGKEQLDSIVELCRKHDAKLALLFRPWQRKFPADAPPTYRGPEWLEELVYLYHSLERLRGWLADAPVPVDAVILECERFKTREGDEAWNRAVAWNHRAVADLVELIFPQARIEWYNRGTSKLFTGLEPGDSYSLSLYFLPELAATRGSFRYVERMARQAGVSDVTPWIALGSAKVRDESGRRVWSFDNPYDPDISWRIGAEINNPWYGDHSAMFAPWHAARVVVFWPPPFDARVPGWAEHFVQYVCGAHGIRFDED